MGRPKGSVVRGKPESNPVATEAVLDTSAALGVSASPEEKQVKPKTKRTITPEARAKAARTRSMKSVFDKYMESLTGTSGRRSESTARKIVEIELMLKAGVKRRKVPHFTDGVRDGVAEKDVPLRFSERGQLHAELQELRGKLIRHPKKGATDLRAEFLDILPEYSESQGWTGAMMIEFGVSEDDVLEAGISIE